MKVSFSDLGCFIWIESFPSSRTLWGKELRGFTTIREEFWEIDEWGMEKNVEMEQEGLEEHRQNKKLFYFTSVLFFFKDK